MFKTQRLKGQLDGFGARRAKIETCAQNGGTVRCKNRASRLCCGAGLWRALGAEMHDRRRPLRVPPTSDLGRPALLAPLASSLAAAQHPGVNITQA